MTLKRLFSGFSAFVLLAGVVWAAAGFGVGATFPYPLYANWANAYYQKSGIGINYQSIGSGGGIAQMEASTATFGASDIPLYAYLLQKHHLLQFPTVIGGIVPIVNLPGIKSGDLVLNGRILAGIFGGRIRKWNDPAIVHLNPGVKLPNLVIVPLIRSDKSGTTYNFTTYLAGYAPNWRTRIGVAAAVNWPDIVVGVKGTEGVANTISRTRGSIGYVEYAYASQNHLTWTRLINRKGEAVSPSRQSFRAAAHYADWHDAAQHNYAVHLIDRDGKGVWPVTAATYVLLPQKGRKPEEIQSVKAFWLWCFRNGDAIAQKLGYVPLPSKVKQNIEQRIDR